MRDLVEILRIRKNFERCFKQRGVRSGIRQEFTQLAKPCFRKMAEKDAHADRYAKGGNQEGVNN